MAEVKPQRRTAFPQLLCVSTMTPKSRRPKGRDDVLSSLDVAIDALNHAKEVSSITPAKAAFGSASNLLALIRVSLILVHIVRLPVNAYRTQ